MRHLLAIYTVMVASLVVFVITRSSSSAAVVHHGPSDKEVTSAAIPGGRTGSVPASRALVVAGKIAARSLAIQSSALYPPIYLTIASSPDRVFLLDASYATASVSPLAPVAGIGQSGSLGDGGMALAAQLFLSTDSLYERSGVAVAADGTIFVADTRNGTVRKIAGNASSELGVIRSVAGRWGPRQNVLLMEPMGIALDRAGNLYIADHGTNAIDVLRAATGKLETIAHVMSPASIAVTTEGDKVFTSSPEGGAVFAIDTESSSIQTVPVFTGGPGACPSMPTPQMRQTQGCPAGLAMDAQSNLFVTDATSGNIIRIDAKSGGRIIAATGLDKPGDIAFDVKGNLYVAEQGRNRIIEFPQMGDPPSNITLAAPTPSAGCQQGTSFTYCNEPTGGTTPPATFTIENNTTNQVTGLTWTLNPSTPANFVFTGTNCISTLSATSSCSINIAFAPQATGLQQDTLTVTDTQGDSTQIVLYGTGDNYQLQLAGGQASELTVAQGNTISFNAQLVSDSVFGENGERVALFCPSSSALPAFTSCVTSPCPATIQPNSTIHYEIVFVTSSPTVTAPLPEPSTPSGCSAYGIQPSLGLVAPDPVVASFHRSQSSLAHDLLFPALVILVLMSISGGIGLKGLRRRWILGTAWHAFGPAILPFAITIAITATFSGCHHSSGASSSGTPVGQTMMQIQGIALDSQGNPLNATRGLPVVTIEVVAAK